MTIERLGIAAEPPSMQLTNLELELINQELNVAIESKQESGQLRFSSSKDEAAAVIDVSKFGLLGLQGPNDLKEFLLTSAGETVIHDITGEINLEREREEELQFEIQQQIMAQERIRSLLFHWLLDDEKSAKKAQEELIIEQQEKILHHDEQHTAQNKSTPKKSADTVFKTYSDSINKYTRDQHALAKHIDQLEKERLLLDEKYETYERNLNEFDEMAHQFEQATEQEINDEIETNKKEKDPIAEKINATKDEKEMHQLRNELNVRDLKIGNLKNIRSVKKGEKCFADANGHFEDEHGKPIAFKNAAFVLSPDQKIEKDETGQYYLLKKEQKLADMNEDDKKIAQKSYEYSKKDLQLSKHIVQHLKKEELHLNAVQLAKHKAEHSVIQNHIKLMQKAQAHSHKHRLTSHLRLSTPQSSMTPEKAASKRMDSLTKPAASTTAQEIFGDFVRNAPKPMTWGILFKFVENEVPSPKAKKIATKFLVDEIKKDRDNNPKDPKQDKAFKETLADILKHPEKFKYWLTNTLSAAPVPPATMQDLLKNMATKSQDAYNPEVTTEKSPLALQQEQPSPSIK